MKLVQDGAGEMHERVTNASLYDTETGRGHPRQSLSIAIMTTGIISAALLRMPKPREVLEPLFHFSVNSPASKTWQEKAGSQQDHCSQHCVQQGPLQGRKMGLPTPPPHTSRAQ